MLKISIICSASVNRRLDEWVDVDRFDLSSKLEDPQKIKDVTIMMTDLSDGTDRKLTRNQKRKHDEINHVQKVRQRAIDCLSTAKIRKKWTREK